VSILIDLACSSSALFKEFTYIELFSSPTFEEALMLLLLFPAFLLSLSDYVSSFYFSSGAYYRVFMIFKDYWNESAFDFSKSRIFSFS